MKKTIALLALLLFGVVMYAQETVAKTTITKMFHMGSKEFPNYVITAWNLSGQQIPIGGAHPDGTYIVRTISSFVVTSDLENYFGNQAIYMDNDTSIAIGESHQINAADLNSFLDDAGSDMVSHPIWRADSPCSLPDSIMVDDGTGTGNQVLASREDLVNPVNTICQGTPLFWRDYMTSPSDGGYLQNVRTVGTWDDSLAMLQSQLVSKVDFVDSMKPLLHYVRQNLNKSHEANYQFTKSLPAEAKHRIFVVNDSLGANCAIYTEYFHTLCTTAAGIAERDFITISRSAGSFAGSGHTFCAVRSNGEWFVFDPMNCGIWTRDGIPASVESIAAFMSSDSVSVAGHYARESRIGFDNSSFPETIKLLATPLELWGQWSSIGCIQGVYKTRSTYHETGQDPFVTDTLYGCIGLGQYQADQPLIATRVQLSQGNSMTGTAGFDDMFAAAGVYPHWTSLLVAGMIDDSQLEISLEGDTAAKADFMQKFLLYHH